MPADVIAAVLTSTELSDNLKIQTLITVLGFISTIAALFYQGWREGRKHRWDIEAANKQQTATLTKKLEDGQKEIIGVKARDHAETQQHLSNIEASANAAYKEANSVNMKIADLHAVNLETASLVLLTAKDAQSKAQSDSAQVMKKMQAVEDIAEKAFTEANSYNSKIAELHKEGIAGDTSTHVKLDEIKVTTEDTNKHVHEQLPEKL